MVGSAPITKTSSTNATKKERSIGSRASAGIRERMARTGSTTGAVIRVSTAMITLSSVTNHERIAWMNIQI